MKKTEILSPPSRNKPAWGRRNANCCRFVSYWWTFDLLKTGKQRDLTENDIDEIDVPDSSRYVLNKFFEGWNKQLKENPDSPNLYWTVMYSLGLKRYLYVSASFVLWPTFNIILVTFLQEILRFVEGSHDITFSQAVSYCLLNGLTAFFLAWYHHWFFYETTRVGVLARQVMSAAILDKSLRISPNSLPSAQVVNLMSTDTQRFQIFLKSLPVLILCPYLILAIIWLCYRVNSWFPIFGLMFYLFMYVL